VEEWFVGNGFEVFDFAEHTFLEQLQLVRSAEAIVGPDGSAFMTTFYARPGTRIGVLDNPYLEDNEWYVNICQALGQPLLYLVGEVVHPDPSYRFRAGYRIDVEALPAFLDALMSA
jgi:capsular polysaccharide biosynthesis protein